MSPETPFATTLNYDDDPRWFRRAHVIEFPRGVIGEFRTLISIVRAAFQHETLVLDSSSGRFHPDVLAAALIGFLPRRVRPTIVLTGCMWARDQGFSRLLQTFTMNLADRGITAYAVQSSEELTVFPETWGVSPDKVHFSPYFYSLTEDDIHRLESTPGDVPFLGRYVFAGGNSHRDYEPLLAAAQHFPDVQFVIATSRLQRRQDLPPNVMAGPLPHEDFVRLMKGAAAVYTPIAGGLTRAAGQQTYLNAMRLGVPTIVSDGFAVRDHIEHGQTGLIIDGSVESIVMTLQWLFNPANCSEVEAMVQRAQEVVMARFTFERFVTQTLAIVDAAIEGRQRVSFR
ncbi:MAG: glycosyltransferase [Chloroflexi bacterium]|nr:glycosyltransferase [Chloroflexota bacterium]